MAKKRQNTGAQLLKRSVIDAWTGLSSIVGGWLGAYTSSDPNRKILEDWRPRKVTANQAVVPSLQTLINQGWQLDRQAPTFRGMVEGRKAELVGTGLDIDPQTGIPEQNDRIRDEWHLFTRHAGILGESLWTLQRQASGELDCAGAFLWRALVLPERMTEGRLPLAIQALDIQFLSLLPVAEILPGNRFVGGIEVDKFGRAVRYHLRNPEAIADPGEVVPAREIQYGFERRRAGQLVGEPRLVTLIERTLQDDEIIVTELRTAKSTSAVGMVISDDNLAQLVNGTEGDNETAPPTSIMPGGIAYLPTAATITPFQNNRPSQAVKEFRDTIRGDQAAGAQVSRVWLDRNGSQYNFANSKFDAIRTQQVIKPAQDWFGEAAASWVYELALPWILLRLGIKIPTDPVRKAALFHHVTSPDIPPELDEKAAAEGFTTAYAAGIISRAEFLTAKGKDPGQVAKNRDEEATKDAVLSVARIASIQEQCEVMNKKIPGLNLHWSQITALSGATTAPGAFLQGVAMTATATNDIVNPPQDTPPAPSKGDTNAE